MQAIFALNLEFFWLSFHPERVDVIQWNLPRIEKHPSSTIWNKPQVSRWSVSLVVMSGSKRLSERSGRLDSHSILGVFQLSFHPERVDVIRWNLPRIEKQPSSTIWNQPQVSRSSVSWVVMSWSTHTFWAIARSSRLALSIDRGLGLSLSERIQTHENDIFSILW